MRRPRPGVPVRDAGAVRRAVTGEPPVAGPAEHRALTAVLVGSGVLHLLRPRVFDSIVPRWLPPSQRFWTVASGVAEIGVGLAVASPRTRRAGGYAAAGLFVAVFPANLWMAWLWRRKPLAQRVGVLARLPLQVPLVAWGLRVARATAPGR